MEYIKLFKCLYTYKYLYYLSTSLPWKPFDVIKDSISVFEAGLGC